MSEMIKVGMADYKVCSPPDNLTTLGLGSCVGVAIYDKKSKISGLVHVMLPDSNAVSTNKNKAKFADTGVKLLVDEMVKIGASRYSLTAKIAGGAQMFAFQSKNNMLRVGERNVEAVKKALSELRIPLLAQETGENFGRTVEFYTETGDFLIKSIGRGEHTI